MKEYQPRILCIDDDTHTCEWISIMLRGSRVVSSITSVTTGLEASECLAREHFDLCILDYALPDMTGVQLCRLMRQRGCHVPIMFFTAMNRAVDREMAFAAGATEYLVKPDDFEVFVDEVVRLLNARQALHAFRTGPTREYARAA